MSVTSPSPFSRGVIINEETEKHAAVQLSRMDVSGRDPTQLKNKSSLTVEGHTFMTWDKAVRDLNRYGKLMINGKTIYICYANGKPVNNKTGIEISATSIAKEILSASGGDFVEMLQYMSLMQQYSDSVGYAEVFKKYELKGFMFKQIEKAVSLEVEGDSFRVTNELLGQIINQEDPENTDLISYFKVKTVMSGLRQDLVHEIYDQLPTKIVHTAQYAKESQARAATYGEKEDHSKDAKSNITNPTSNFFDFLKW